MFTLYLCRCSHFLKSLNYNINDFPVAYNNYKSEISLPIYPQLSDEQVDYIVNAVINAYNKLKKV